MKLALSSSPSNSKTSERDRMHDKDKPHAVTFINFTSARRLLHYTSKILEPPFSNPVVLINEHAASLETDTLAWEIVKGTGRDHTDYLGVATGCYNAVEYPSVLQKSRALVMFGSGVLGNHVGNQDKVSEFIKFYRRGGTIVSIAGDLNRLNEIFGCQWEPEIGGHFHCVPTQTADALLGFDDDGRPVVPAEVYIGNAKLIEVPRGEALYVPRPYATKRQFLAQHSEVEDFWYDDENEQILQDKFMEMYPKDKDILDEFLDLEQDWYEYVPPTATPLAIHLSEETGGGAIVWVGDVLEEDTRMRSLLARL